MCCVKQEALQNRNNINGRELWTEMQSITMAVILIVIYGPHRWHDNWISGKR